MEVSATEPLKSLKIPFVASWATMVTAKGAFLKRGEGTWLQPKWRNCGGTVKMAFELTVAPYGLVTVTE